MRKIKYLAAALLILAAGAAATRADEPRPIYKDATAPLDQRVADLLERMNLDEKVAQVRGLWQLQRDVLTNGAFDPAKAPKVLGNGIGEIGPIRRELAREIELRNALQKYLREQTRLGIPALFHDEGCHGLVTLGATSFPVPIGLACSWDPDLVERIYTVVAAEMRSRGSQHALAPVVDICREPRWGRTDETMGEDPYLNGKLGAAMVRGFQGGPANAIGPDHVMATLKHLVGHGQPESGINRGPATVPLRELYDAHLEPFRIVIREAHPAAVMPSYNEVDGVPSHANTWLLRDVLRQEFAFDGLIASDYTGIEYLAELHGVAADQAQAARLALQAGVELNLPDGRAYTNLKALVEKGAVQVKLLDAAVRKMLRAKFMLGLFENPYADARQADALVQRDSSKALALEAARRSIVLLKNANHLLPLDAGKYKTIAVIGPNANEARLGSYSGDPLYKVTVFEGIKARAGAATNVVYAQGCQIIRKLSPSSKDAWERDKPEAPDAAASQAAIQAAVATAQTADVIILVLGEVEAIARESWGGYHPGDRASLELFGPQAQLAAALHQLGKPLVVYLMNGKPLAIPALVDQADAVVEGWYMGQETGHAAADVLFGAVNPAGKLTITFPRSTGQIPAYYNCKPGARIFPYVDEVNAPLFPFGFGLSYTTFSYAQPQLSTPTMSRTGWATVSVTVTNTGPVPGDEIVQLYIHDRVASVTRPIKELKGFRRITLAPGASREVTFEIVPDLLAFHDIWMERVVEPGDYEIMTGPSSAALKKAVLRITE